MGLPTTTLNLEKRTLLRSRIDKVQSLAPFEVIEDPQGFRIVIVPFYQAEWTPELIERYG